MIDSLIGEFAGTGTWFEASGMTSSYNVSHTITKTPRGFRFEFKHVFENGDPDVHAVFDMEWSSAPLFVLKAADSEIGKGYVLDVFCHYTTDLGGNIVEASVLKTEDGVRVWGSASRNKAGHAIAWNENLKG